MLILLPPPPIVHELVGFYRAYSMPTTRRYSSTCFQLALSRFSATENMYVHQGSNPRTSVIASKQQRGTTPEGNATVFRIQTRRPHGAYISAQTVAYEHGPAVVDPPW